MQILPEEGTLASQLGSALGRGASQAFPDAFKRGRLASAFDTLKKSPHTSSELDLASQFIRSGATPEDMNMYLPLITAEQARKEAIAQGQKRPLGSLPQNPPMKGGMNQDEMAPQDVKETMSISPDRDELSIQRFDAPDFMIKAQDPQIRELQAQLMLESPRLYRDPQNAYNKAKQIYDDRYQTDVDLYEKRNKAENRFQKLFDSYKLKDNISPEAFTNFQKMLGEESIKMGVSPDLVANKVFSNLQNLAEASQRLRNIGKSLGDTPDEVNRAMSSIQKEYANQGLLKDFRNDLISYNGMSPQGADYLAYPLSKKMTEALTKLSTSKTEIPKGGLLGKSGSKKYDEAVELIQKNFDPKTDNINSISLELQSKGFDPLEIKKRLLRKYDEGTFGLGKEQAAELQSPQSWYPYLGDILILSKMKRDRLLNE